MKLCKEVQKKTVRALIFDMDGTLYHHPVLNERYNRSIYKMVAYVKRIPLADAKIVFRKEFLKNKSRLKREPSKLFVLNQLGISDKDWAKKYGAQVAPDKWLKDDKRLRKTLIHLQKYFKLAVVTNNHKRNTIATLSCLNILDCFDEILTLSDTGIYKPSSRLYKIISKKLNIDPQEALSIGDRCDLDLAPAAAIGMQTLLVSSMKDIYCLSESLKPACAEKVKLTKDNIKEVINISSIAIKKGRLIVMSTDTVCGLAGRPTKESIDWIYRIKGRKENSPIVLLIDHPGQAERFVNVSDYAKAIINAHWPGALTLVLPVKSGTDWGKITRGGRWIGLRCPDHDFSRRLIKRCGGALATTSANSSGAKAPEKASDVDTKILAFSEILIDAGKKKNSISSTVAKIKGKKAIILRKGPIILSC